MKVGRLISAKLPLNVLNGWVLVLWKGLIGALQEVHLGMRISTVIRSIIRSHNYFLHAITLITGCLEWWKPTTVCWLYSMTILYNSAHTDPIHPTPHNRNYSNDENPRRSADFTAWRYSYNSAHTDRNSDITVDTWQIFLYLNNWSLPQVPEGL